MNTDTLYASTATTTVVDRPTTMRAAAFVAPGRIDVLDFPYPTLIDPTDAVIRVVLTCVCGSDLWPYRGVAPQEPGPMGHEFMGTVEQVGAAVRGVVVGDLVIAPFAWSCGECPNCLAGIQTACTNGGFWAGNGIGGGQAGAVRVPLADGTLVRVPGTDHSDEMMRSLLTLSDVMGTGHHAAVSASVAPGSVVAVVGDGAVGLSAVIAAKRLGASRVIALSRHPERQALALEFGASEVVAERGHGGIEAVLKLTDGVGVDAALECVGTNDAMATAIGIVRAGGSIGYVGVPHGVELPVETLFYRNIGVRGGPAPVRAYLPELLDDVLAGRINPGRVFDFETDLEHIGEAYAAMDERRAIKSLVRVGTAV
jgi:threonine dehydrogenase-like Zn-dependent dehydrogenase